MHIEVSLPLSHRRNIQNNLRVLILLNGLNSQLCHSHPSIFNHITMIAWPHWSLSTLVQNSLYHLKGNTPIVVRHSRSPRSNTIDVRWLDEVSSENTAHLLASMHLASRRANDTHSTERYAHMNNEIFTRLVEK